MEATPDTWSQRQNLSDLQARSLRLIALFVGLVGYVWLFFVVWPGTGASAPPEAWAGDLLLLLSAGVSYALRKRRLLLASCLLVLGALGAVASALVAFRAPDLAYLFALPIIFASVLLGQIAIFLTAGLAGSLALAIGLGRFGLLLSSRGLWLPMAVIALITTASWLSLRNLHIALAWVWSGYEQAHRNERVARQQQAELRQVLKALDEATYRLERANYMLTLARDQAEEARRLKQQFAQTISHELRTPLNLIVSFTELMAQAPEYYGGPLPAAYARDLGIVYRNARHLQGLVNDVLDLARIEAAQMSLLPEETDPAVLVQEATNAARSLVEARGLALRTEIEPDLPRLWIDPTRIRQVFFNLLNNAAHFTERGSITVSVRRLGDEIAFAVADTGVGIAPQDMPRIFEEFQQVDGSTRRRHGGAGLGLAISRRFVELHGGRIWAESQVGQGSLFHFSLPIARRDLISDARSGLARESPAAPAVGRDERILLAATASAAAAALLTRYVHACRTVIVQDLEHALRAARHLLPQAIIIDTAHQTLDPRALQDMAQASGLPRAVVVACPLPGKEPLQQRLAVDGYLVKPVSRQGLWDVLRQLGQGIDKVLVVDDDRDFVRLMGRLLDSPIRRYHVINAYNAQEALEMIEYHQPDLVLLDLILPDNSGTQVIERLRADPKWRYLPIVVVSAQDEIDTIEALPGTIQITRANGLLPGEIVQCVQNVLDMATRHVATASGQAT